MKKGDIVLIHFPFTDLSGAKRRPAIILVESADDITVAFVTTQLKWREQFDIQLQPNLQNGLKRISLVRLSKLATIDKDLVIGKLGGLSIPELKLLNQNLIDLLKLDG